MNTSQKTELTVSVRHIQRFLKSGILIYNCEVQDTPGRKTRRRRRRRRRKKTIAKRYVFHKNAIKKAQEETLPNVFLISGPLALADLISSSRFK